MLVDAHWPPPEPGPERPSFPWRRVAWPNLTVLLIALGFVVPPLIAYACLIGALYCAIECFALLIPNAGGMRDYKQ